MQAEDKPPPILRRAIWGLGVTMIVSYGTIYYAFALLAAEAAKALAVPESWLFAVFSGGLLASGLAAPRLGRLMDQLGAPRIMAWGSLAAALLLGVASQADSFPVYAGIIITLEIVGFTIFYDAAFATLAFFGGNHARRAVTHLTLIAGFSSTLYWPLSGWLVAALGWRGTYAVFALTHLAVCWPIHAWLAQQARSLMRRPLKAMTVRPVPSLLTGREAAFAFWAIAASFAMSNVLIAALGVHLVPLLKLSGLGAGAYAISMLIGPAQVFARLIDALYWQGFHPLSVSIISAAAIPVSLMAFFVAGPAWAAATIFAIAFGVGQGLASIVRGTVPLILFGSEAYGARLGQLAIIRTVFAAGAPFLFALMLEQAGKTATLLTGVVIGLLALLPLVLLRMRMRRATEM